MLKALAKPMVRAYARRYIAGQLRTYSGAISLVIVGLLAEALAQVAQIHAGGTGATLILTGIALSVGKTVQHTASAMTIQRLIEASAAAVERGDLGPTVLVPMEDVIGPTTPPTG